jgi:hypothetical protein
MILCRYRQLTCLTSFGVFKRYAVLWIMIWNLCTSWEHQERRMINVWFTSAGLFVSSKKLNRYLRYSEAVTCISDRISPTLSMRNSIGCFSPAGSSIVPCSAARFTPTMPLYESKPFKLRAEFTKVTILGCRPNSCSKCSARVRSTDVASWTGLSTPLMNAV